MAPCLIASVRLTSVHLSIIFRSLPLIVRRTWLVMAVPTKVTIALVEACFAPTMACVTWLVWLASSFASA